MLRLYISPCCGAGNSRNGAELPGAPKTCAVRQRAHDNSRWRLVAPEEVAMKRVMVATALGVIAGFICMLGGMSVGIAMTASLVIWIFLNRAVLGFVIGISGLRMHWALHGVVMGAVIGSLFSYAAYLLQRPALVIATTAVANLIFGVLIEFFTTVVFKLPQQVPSVTKEPEKPAAAA